jgi:hypothetical protein
MDVEAVVRFARLERQWPWRGFDMAILILASGMKWPHAIMAFEAALRGVDIESGPDPEVVLATCIMAAAEACDAMVMEEMHNELSKTGRAGCTTGLIWLLRRLRFVADDSSQPDEPDCSSTAGSQPDRKRKSAKTTVLAKRHHPEEAQDKVAGVEVHELRLGKLQNTYVVESGRVSEQSCRRSCLPLILSWLER